MKISPEAVNPVDTNEAYGWEKLFTEELSTMRGENA